MKCLKIVREPWRDSDGSKTESLYLPEYRAYTVSELIALLEEAGRVWGDKEVLIHESTYSNDVVLARRVFLHHGFDDREENGNGTYVDDAICILFE